MACCVGPQQAETRQQKVKHSKTRIQTANRGYSHCVIVRADIVQKTRRTASPSVCGSLVMDVFNFWLLIYLLWAGAVLDQPYTRRHSINFLSLHLASIFICLYTLSMGPTGCWISTFHPHPKDLKAFDWTLCACWLCREIKNIYTLDSVEYV